MSDILERILAHKREEVVTLRRHWSEPALRERAAAAPALRPFAQALRDAVAAGQAAVIAEIKRASPSKGLIREDFDPAWIAREYAAGGAACLSVLTDQRFFQGGNPMLEQARAACALPALRKDFVIDPIQVIEARAIGADCVLLIAAALSTLQLGELAGCARELGLDVLVEVHDHAELGRVASAGLPAPLLLGINNRSLRTFEVRLETTLGLLTECPPGADVVSESGIASALDIERLRAAGVHRFLVGESLMREPSPARALRRLLGTAPA